MKFSDLKKAMKGYRSVFFAEDFLPRRSRNKTEAFLIFVAFIFGISFIFGLFRSLENILDPLFLLLLACFVALRMIELYSFAHETDEFPVADFETLSIVYKSDPKDLVRGLLISDVGETVLLRAGFEGKQLHEYLRKERTLVTATDFDSAASHFSAPLKLSQYVGTVTSLDKNLLALLGTENSPLQNIEKSAQWVSSLATKTREKTRWWSRENLASSFIHARKPLCSAECPVSGKKEVLSAILDRANTLERHERVFFTYPALARLSEKVSNCVIGTIALDKAYEFLDALPKVAKSDGESVVCEGHVKKLFTKN